ncbi:hypothetical protein HDZ31DRAFT_85172 [Schizophyllum fasciatum]
MSLSSTRAVPPDELEQRAELMARGPLLAGLLGPLGLAAPVCGILRKLPLAPVTDALCGKEGTVGAASVEDFDDGSYDAESDDRLDELRAAVASVSSMLSVAGVPTLAPGQPSPPIPLPSAPVQPPAAPVQPPAMPVDPSTLPVGAPAAPVSPPAVPVDPSTVPVQPPVPVPIAAAADDSGSAQPPSRRAHQDDDNMDDSKGDAEHGNSRAPPNTPIPSHSAPSHHPAESAAPSQVSKAPLESSTAPTEHAKGPHSKSSDSSSSARKPAETAASDA